MIPTIVTCPLGSRCEEIKNDVLHRCRWMVKLIGKDPQSQNDIDEWNCAIAWIPLMMVEVGQGIRGTTESVVSMRDATVERADVFNAILSVATKRHEELLKKAAIDAGADPKFIDTTGGH